MPLLEAKNLKKSYGRRQVVCGVSFEVGAGEIVGLLGPNGAGKTTSFRMTIGLIDADGGQVLFSGRDVTRLPMFQRARLGMGYLAQDSSVFRMLSVQDNLMAILETRRDLNGRQRKARQKELLEQFGLTEVRRNKGTSISGGQRRRLEIARALINEPKLIMLDEPFAGIDPKTVDEIQIEIARLARERNIGILITDHNVRETLKVTDRSYLLAEGRVVAHGSVADILNNPDARRYYLGDHFDAGGLIDRPRHSALPGETRLDPGQAREAPHSAAARPQAPDPTDSMGHSGAV